MGSTSTGQSWRTRFDAFVAAKTLRATTAILPPYITEWDASRENGLLAIGSAWTRQLFDGDFYISPPRASHRPACSLVFVQSADGNTEARDPGTLGGGQTDKHLIYEGLSRVAADAVLVGGETARGGNTIFSVWHPELVALRSAFGLPRHPTQIVATLRGVRIEESLLFSVPDVPVVVLTVPAAAEKMEPAVALRPWIRMVVMRQATELAGAFARLRAIGLATISCIGGRTLAAQLLAARLVDDVYLTTGATAGGVDGTPLSPSPWRARVLARKHGTGPEAAVLFEHIVPRP
jgi:riboflavin biosynthesis pyrimidine reductase